MSSDLVVLERAECIEILSTQRLCVLATADADQPYAIPMFYGFDGDTLYVGITEGRKTEVLDVNPRVCVTVTDVQPGQAWRSVLVTGRAEWVADAAERATAIQVLIAHNRRSRERLGEPEPPSSSAPRRQGLGRMMRVADATITGRARR